MKALFHKFGIPTCVAFAHAVPLFYLFTHHNQKIEQLTSQNFIILNLLANQEEIKAPEEEIIQKEIAQSSADEQTEDQKLTELHAIDLNEAFALNPISLPEYQLKEVEDAAAGSDGNTKGEGINFGKFLGNGANIEIGKTEIQKQEKLEIHDQGSEKNKLPEKIGAEKIGKQGNPNALHDGNFGSEGEGGTKAFASARFKNKVAPVYPLADKLAGRTGTVVLLIKINASGELENIKIKKSSGSKTLDAAAIRAAKSSSYLPAQNGKTKIESFAEATYVFKK